MCKEKEWDTRKQGSGLGLECQGSFGDFSAQLVGTGGETLPVKAKFLPDFSAGSSSCHQEKDHRV